MNAAQLLRDWGFELSVKDDDLIEISPFSKVDEELKRWILRNKFALIRDINAADAAEIDKGDFEVDRSIQASSCNLSH